MRYFIIIFFIIINFFSISQINLDSIRSKVDQSEIKLKPQKFKRTWI
jgi:hypothetical protein